MLQAVVLGIGGVLGAWETLRQAEIDAACAWLSAQGIASERFAAAAQRRHGQPAWVTRALADSHCHLPSGACRELVLATRAAIPAAAPTPHRAGLVDLARRHVLGALDCGPRLRLERWSERLGVADLFRHRLCTDDLGGAAQPPRVAAFRFLARQLDLRAAECLYLAGAPAVARAARAAGWHVVAFAMPPGADFDWDACVAAAVAGDR
jgi:FMN phosphatase YigB (HAD superfamily)